MNETVEGRGFKGLGLEFRISRLIGLYSLGSGALGLKKLFVYEEA